MAAPEVLLAACIAASENIVVGSCAGKVLGDLKFRQRPEHTKVVNAAIYKLPFIIVKIQFKFKAFGLLMIDRTSGYCTFVGAGFVGKRNVAKSMKVGSHQGGESNKG